MSQAFAEEMVTLALAQDMEVLDVIERDGGEIRVIHQLAEDDTVEDAEDNIAQVARAFLTQYAHPQFDPDMLTGAIVSGDGERAATYYCEEEWADGTIEANPDPLEATDERLLAIQSVVSTIGDSTPVDDLSAIGDFSRVDGLGSLVGE